MHAEKCPICDGSGKTKVGKTKFPCYGCGGKGWVEVGDCFPPLSPAPYHFWEPPNYFGDRRLGKTYPLPDFWL